MNVILLALTILLSSLAPGGLASPQENRSTPGANTEHRQPDHGSMHGSRDGWIIIKP
jgi:hypothetical protein